MQQQEDVFIKNALSLNLPNVKQQAQQLKWTKWNIKRLKYQALSSGTGGDQIKAKRRVNVGFTLISYKLDSK